MLGVCAASAGWVLAGQPLASQGTQAQTPPRTTFRAAINLIEVDAVVRDKRGMFVLGATADNFEVYEDDVKQPIQLCYLVTSDPVTGLASVNGVASNPADIKSHRIFVLVFDEGDLDTGSLLRIKQGAIDFVTRDFKEGDLGGVVVNGRLYQGKLTSSKPTLIAGIRAVRPAFDSRESRMRVFREFPRIPGESEAIRIVNGDRFLIQDLGETACREDPAACTLEGGLQQVENRLQVKARQYLGQARDATRYTLEALQQTAVSLAPYPGRKTMVFFSDGFFVEESRSVVRELAGIAARAGATIYSVDGRGLAGARPTPPDVVMRERPIGATHDTGEDGPTILTVNTGGFVVRRMDNIPKALGMIADDTSTYYVIGYQPTNRIMDGKFRKITVKPTNPELTIRARKGYMATALPPMPTTR